MGLLIVKKGKDKKGNPDYEIMISLDNKTGRERGLLKIALTCSIKPEDRGDRDNEDKAKDKYADKYAEFDSRETINELAEAIKANGYEVEIIDVKDYTKESIREILQNKKEDIHLVFNVAEGLNGEERESLVPSACEELAVPFTAAGSQTLIITLNKAKTKEVLEKSSIPTPEFQLFENGDEELKKELKFPLLVKPLLEGSSKGLFNENLVGNIESLRKIAVKTIKNYSQPAIAEEFLDGREFTVSVVGYKNPVVLPIVEVKFEHLPKHLHPMDSYESKWIYDSREFIEKNPDRNPLKCPAELDKKLKNRIEETALKTFKVLDCKDWTRIDIRLDKNDIPNVLEVNALPGFMKEPKENSRLPKAAYAAGWSYERLIREVIKSAEERWGLRHS